MNERNFLIRATLRREKAPSFSEFPFSIPAIGSLDTIEFDRPVTFFVGENGSGKSTLLETTPSTVACRAASRIATPSTVA